MFQLNTKTVAVTDYKQLNANVARVMLSYTGALSQEDIRKSIAAKFEGQAHLVEGSAREVQAGVAVAFLRANTEVRVVDEKSLTAGYKLVASNMVMDNEDRSLWSVKTGKGGKFLTRTEQQDLSELITAHVHRTPGVPGLRHLTAAKAAKSELVAYVTQDGSMDYGFAVAGNDEKVRLVSFKAQAPITVGYDQVCAIMPVQIDRETKKQISAALSPADKANAIAYWRTLYSFAPDYMNEVIRQVEQGAVA